MPDTIIHSEEVHEMIVQAPGGIVRYGAYTFLIFIMVLLGLCWTIEYSDTEQGECIIYSDNAPRPVVGRTEGQLGALFVSDGMHVTRNQSLGIIKTSTRLNDVLRLEALVKSCLENVNQNSFEKIYISHVSFNQIGEFQGAFQHLYWIYMQITSVIQSPVYKQLKSITGTSTEQNNKLAATPVNLLEYQKQFFQLVAQFVQSINEINADINLWKQKYLLTAPIDGTVIFPEVVFKNKEITPGQEVFYVSPQSKNYYAQITLSQAGYSKVKPGQPVTVKLEGQSERKPLYGHVSYVSPIINKEGKVTVKMLFDKQKINTAGEPVSVAHQLKGTGMIITGRNSLLSKIFRSIKN
jgi:hypothetical protein